MPKIFQIYFIIVVTTISIALSIGLVAGLVVVPNKTDCKQIYLFAKQVTVIFSLITFGIIFILTKTKKIKINETLVEEK
jgi:hypothetical protein